MPFIYMYVPHKSIVFTLLDSVFVGIIISETMTTQPIFFFDNSETATTVYVCVVIYAILSTV